MHLYCVCEKVIKHSRDVCVCLCMRACVHACISSQNNVSLYPKDCELMGQNDDMDLQELS